ncbi:pyruvate kinase [Floccifex sp.]|uniref:pyruvate kinase n=1 Tax=Floccifex sp. TaxID=2815810 RepID=UPI003F0B0049
MNLEIYGTLGPSCCDEETIRFLFEKGMTGMRLNLSHVTLKQASKWLQSFHRVSQNLNFKPNLLMDMQGPELRVKEIYKDLKLNEIVDVYECAFPDCVIQVLEKGQHILLDDGKILLEMMDKKHAKVVIPGILKSHKSLAIENVSLDMPALTSMDIENISMAKQYGVTGLMQPFVRNKEDLIYIQNILKKYDSDLKIYAKIENKEGIQMLEELLPYCDQIVIARGDLANSVGIVNLPSVQKQIEKTCKEKNVSYMVVTEMLNSMIENPMPTRAEVSDIYHAIYHGARSIMLTGETAIGKYPVQAMDVFVQVAKKALEDRK